MKTNLKNRQGGAVAVMVAAGLVMIIGFLAMVIDLGHLYIAKTELQNAADAAALSGAKQLNGTLLGVYNTAAGIDCGNKGAVQCAIETAATNKYDLSSSTVDITIADIWVGDCPDDSCMVAASSITSNADAARMTFLKVHTRNRNMVTWFARIWNILNMSTYGMAVAGKYSIDVSPVGICQLTSDNPTNELGYERGVSYKVSDANPLAPGTPFWIDPVEMAPTPCVPSHNNANNTVPYMCTGKMAYTPTAGSIVYTNTGTSVPVLRAVDSRFNDYYSGASFCDPATAPPDSNIKEYIYNSSVAGSPRSWMAPDPVQQSITFLNGQPKSWNTRTFADYGILWSFSRPAVAANDTTDVLASARWTDLYKAPASAVTGYPQTSPYAQTSGSFFTAPTTNTPKSGRRVLNMAIVACNGGGGNCSPKTVAGIGRFFLQRRANSSNEIYVEFGGLLPSPLPTSNIRIYR